MCWTPGSVPAYGPSRRWAGLMTPTDLRTFYPTTLLITGFDILFFWVARMIMLGIWCTGDVPFREVHMHGLVRDAEKQKMSKTKGNVVDPLDLIDRYGTDACRVGLLVSAAPGADIALQEERLGAARGFANKLWNASRLLFMNMERSGVKASGDGTALVPGLESSRIEDRWIFSRLDTTTDVVNRALAQHRYHEAAQTLWDFVWHEFCDWYLEVKKLRFEEASGRTADWAVTLHVYDTILRLLHPFMPFITEELWQRLVRDAQAGQHPASISITDYPRPLAVASTPVPDAERQFELLRRIVTAARELRADNKLDPKLVYDASLQCHGVALAPLETPVLEALTKLRIQSRSHDSGLLRSTPEFDLRIHAQPAEASNGAGGSDSRARIEKEIQNLEKVIESSNRQLSDETFLGKAPAKVVETVRAKLSDYQAQLAKNKKLLEGLD